MHWARMQSSSGNMWDMLFFISHMFFALCFKTSFPNRFSNKLILLLHRKLMARPWCFYGVTWSWSTWGWNWVLLLNFAITLRDSNRWNNSWNLLSKNRDDPLEGNRGKRRFTRFQSGLHSRYVDIYYLWHWCQRSNMLTYSTCTHSRWGEKLISQIFSFLWQKTNAKINITRLTF